MRIEINRAMKIVLLNALKQGYIDTEELDAAVRNLIESHNPPRTLTPDEIREYGLQLEKDY
ncbi:hypothetical protein [uncultured Alistipes sp.]|uniref:hypothetical protein n=2 Tax=uncultured Alistipes sp. TaxID=538949 RepID=UPI0025D6C83B|nr:hypothetical protein [uncultured Alistipes sp.]